MRIVARSGGMRVLAVAAVMMAVIALLLCGATGCKKKDKWEDYVGVWMDGGGSVTPTGSRIQAWALTVHSNGNISFDIRTSAGGYSTHNNEEPDWSDDSFTYTSVDSDGDTVTLTVVFTSGSRASWTLTGNLNWTPVSGSLIR